LGETTLQTWREDILNYVDYPYTNGFLEGKNANTKASSFSVKRKPIGIPGGF
jgi:hypothetical protein